MMDVKHPNGALKSAGDTPTGLPPAYQEHERQKVPDDLNARLSKLNLSQANDVSLIASI